MSLVMYNKILYTCDREKLTPALFDGISLPAPEDRSLMTPFKNYQENELILACPEYILNMSYKDAVYELQMRWGNNQRMARYIYSLGYLPAEGNRLNVTGTLTCRGTRVECCGILCDKTNWLWPIDWLEKRFKHRGVTLI